MSNYTKSTNFATKDNLPTGDPLKIVKGTEIDTEFNNISTAIATKTDNASAAITGGTIAGVTVTSSNATITGGSITGITDLAIADGGTGASTAANAINNLLPSQTGNASKYLQSDGTNPFWDAISLSTADITGTLGTANGGTGSTSTTFANLTTNVTGTLPVANGGTGVTSSTGSGNNVLSTSPTLVTPILGTPTSATLTNATGLPLSTGISGLGTGVATALAINTPNIGAMVVNGGALGTPSSGTVTNLTGTASININGQVGSSTPNSGNFTTLSASSTVNISGGTVDGVLYLDASKNITTGSVLSFSGVHLTSNRTKDTTYSGTDYTTYPNGFILQNSATPATGLFNSIYFKNNGNMQNVFGVVQNSSGYGDFVWAGFSGSYAEAMRLTSSGLSVTGTVGATSGFNGTIGAGTTNTGAFTTISSTEGLALATSSAGDVFYIGQAPNRVFINAGATDNYIRSQTGALGLYAAGATTFAGGIQIISGGNVGINVSNPTSKLDVGGTLGVSGAVTLSGGTANGVTYLNGSKVLTSGSALTFNGTSLGVGSSSYGDAGSITASIGVPGTTAGGLQLWASSAQEHYIQWGDSTTGSATYAGAISYSHASDFMRFWTSSTEQMRLTSTSLYTASGIDVGIGLSNPIAKLDVAKTSSDTISRTNASGAFGDYQSLGAGLLMQQTLSSPYGFALQAANAANSLQFPLLLNPSGGNVGIGTSSPAGKLTVKTGTNENLSVVTGGSGDMRISALNDAASATVQLSIQASPLYLRGNGGAINATLDSAGNLGLGVTPSAWYTSFGTKVFQFAASGVLYGLDVSNSDRRVILQNNAYVNGDGNEIYLNTGAATKFLQSAGAHSWHTAASGTAGNAISFTQALTLDASGNLLVGQTAVGNGGKLAVNGSISICTSTTGTQSSMAKDTTQLTASISTSATTIYTDISSGMSSASAGYFIIYGSNNAGAGFMDVVVAKANGTPVVVSSSTIEGSPAARTYSVSSYALQLTMASGTYNVNLKATVLGYPF